MIPKRILEETSAKAIMGRNILQIAYKKKDGKIVHRQIEPYEIKEEATIENSLPTTYLYGYDISAHIPYNKRVMKRWIGDHFLTMRILKERTYEPRY